LRQAIASRYNHAGMAQPNHRLSLIDPAVYHIRVQGEVDESWSSYLSGLTIAHEAGADQGVTTLLSGIVLDQAALMGVLNMLYSLGSPLLSVECIAVGAAC
jgi:hypothetical protein